MMDNFEFKSRFYLLFRVSVLTSLTTRSVFLHVNYFSVRLENRKIVKVTTVCCNSFQVKRLSQSGTKPVSTIYITQF